MANAPEFPAPARAGRHDVHRAPAYVELRGQNMQGRRPCNTQVSYGSLSKRPTDSVGPDVRKRRQGLNMLGIDASPVLTNVMRLLARSKQPAGFLKDAAMDEKATGVASPNGVAFRVQAAEPDPTRRLAGSGSELIRWPFPTKHLQTGVFGFSALAGSIPAASIKPLQIAISGFHLVCPLLIERSTRSRSPSSKSA